MARRRSASTDVCPLELKSLRTDEDTSVSVLDRETTPKSCTEDQQEEEGMADSGGDVTKGFIHRVDDTGVTMTTVRYV